jgi:basic membrane protein A
MSTLSKRSLLGLTAIGALVALAGCGKKDEPAPQAAAPASAAAEPAAAAAEPLKVAWIYVGPVGTPAGATRTTRAARRSEAAFGDKVKTTFVESVPEGADTERVLRDLAPRATR